ncbi:hypothetical protein, partial [Thiolapillus sp.]
MTINGTPVASLSVKDFRQLLTEDTQPCSVNFWKKRFDTEIDNRYWEVAFNANQETRLKVLQWKILHNIYPTNILLHKMGIANSETCNACHSGEMDYIEHFFFTCEKINPIWQLVKKEILLRTGSTITISLDTALLGHPGQACLTPNILTINYLITLAKMCISKYRYGDTIPIELIFERELRLRDPISLTSPTSDQS